MPALLYSPVCRWLRWRVQSLTLNLGFRPQTWIQQHLAELRTLTQLDELQASLEAGDLLRLLQAPCTHPLQWTMLHDCKLDDACVALLPTVAPHLQSVYVSDSSAALTSLAFLTQLPALTDLFVGYLDQRRRVDHLLSTLPDELPLLTELHVNGSHADSKQLAAVMARLPALQQLTLDDSQSWTDFSFLQPVRQSLHTLQLITCYDMDQVAKDEATLLELADMPRLTSLTLLQTYELGALARRAMQPPSALFPSLTHFEYMG